MRRASRDFSRSGSNLGGNLGPVSQAVWSESGSDRGHRFIARRSWSTPIHASQARTIASAREPAPILPEDVRAVITYVASGNRQNDVYEAAGLGEGLTGSCSNEEPVFQAHLHRH